MNLPKNLKNLLTGLLKPVNYGKKSVVDNIGPKAWSYHQKNNSEFWQNYLTLANSTGF
jgi:hypothetical protein